MEYVFILRHKYRFDSDFDLVGVFTSDDKLKLAKEQYIKMHNEHKESDHIWWIKPIKLDEINI